MERDHHLARETGHGRIAISSAAIAQIVGRVAGECYGVVGMVGRRGLIRLRGRDPITAGVHVNGRDEGLEIELDVVVEYGLNLAEVASTIRTRVAYEVERQTGLPVASVEVRIEHVRRSD
jgi:uncharacterized alkaline shock family protein YloU